jgi:hypothetical protein
MAFRIFSYRNKIHILYKNIKFVEENIKELQDIHLSDLSGLSLMILYNKIKDKLIKASKELFIAYFNAYEAYKQLSIPEKENWLTEDEKEINKNITTWILLNQHITNAESLCEKLMYDLHKKKYNTYL